MAKYTKTFYLDKDSDVKELRRLLLEEDDDELLEYFQDESDTDGEDHLQIPEDSGESGLEEETAPEDDESRLEDDKNYFLGKDKETKWNKNPLLQRERHRSFNIIKKFPGTTQTAKNARTPLECWSCIFSDDILDIILQYTNQYIETIQGSFDRHRDSKPIDAIELRAYIGLLVLAGLNRSNRQNLEDLWGSDGDGIEKFRLVMSIKRFKFITRCLRFDNRITRNERKQTDKLAHIREIFTIFVQNCQKSYTLGENVTIDEKLEGFRGRCSFRQYMPSKPNKYGIKIFALVDAKVFYVYNLEIYAGLQPEGQFRLSNEPSDIVLRLCEPIYKSGRNITADNCFTSFPLIDKLREEKLSYVGTVKMNKRELPPEFTRSNKREVNSSIFGFKNGCTLVSYIPKKGKNVILASSLHGDNEIDPDSTDKQKPSILTFYNQTEGAVDTTDKLCASYNVARNVRRWSMVIFFAMVNMSEINAQVIYLSNNITEGNVRRKTFLKKLSHELVLPHIVRRSVNPVGLQHDLVQRLSKYRPQNLSDDVEEDPLQNQRGTKRKRCQVCTVKPRLTKYNCKKCKDPVCLMHIEPFCSKCSEFLLPPLIKEEVL